MGKLTDALGHFEKAKEFRTQLYNKDRKSHSRQSDLVTAYIQFADVATEVANMTNGAERDARLRAAVEAYGSAIDILDVATPRDNDGVFNSYTKIGDIRVQQGDRDKAFEAYSGALEIARAMAAKDAVKSPVSTEWASKAEQLNRKIQDLEAKPQDSPAPQTERAPSDAAPEASPVEKSTSTWRRP
jgi:tetratricopeptide (TPR) repeat protein